MQSVIYCRRSSESGDNQNLIEQERSCREYAVRNDIPVTAVIAHNVTGVIPLSARAPDLWSDLQAHRVKILIVKSIDRLSRGTVIDALTMIRDVTALGCVVHSLDLGIANPDDVQTIIRAWLSFEEKKRIVERLSENRIGKAKRQWVGAGIAPYGYTKRGEGRSAALVINEEESAIVRQIFAKYATGAATMRGLAEWLNQIGIPSPAGKLWRYGTVRWILRSSIYVGRIHYGGVEVTDNALAFIPLHEWQTSQQRMRSNQLNAARNTKYQYLMQRHIYCVCGARMTPVTNAGNKPRYICMRRIEPKAHKCYESADTGQIDLLATDYIRWAMNDEVLTQGIIEKERQEATANQQAPNRIVAIESELSGQRKRVDRLMRAFGDGDDAALNVIISARESIASLEAERDRLLNAEHETESRRLARESIALHVKRLRYTLDNPTFEMLRELVNILDVRATLTRDKVGRGVRFGCSIAPDLFFRL